MVTLPEAIYRSNTILIKITETFITSQKKKSHAKIHVKPGKILDNQLNPENKRLILERLSSQTSRYTLELQ